MSSITANRYHDISVGHKVTGHESKCAHLHGHNYRVHFECSAEHLDNVGRVIDFSVIKERLCMWLEKHWDHKFLVYHIDPIAEHLYDLDPEGVILVGFNPTAENMAAYLLHVVSLHELAGTGVTVKRIIIEETRKCSVIASI